MLQSTLLHRILLAFGLCLILGAAQCVVVPPPPGGGGYPPSDRYEVAQFTKYAECSRRRGENQGGGFLERRRDMCYSCPRGYDRSSRAIDGPRACVRRAGRYSYAEQLGRPGCRAPGEFRIDDRCYVCPRGYRPSPPGSPRCVLRR